GRAGDDRRYAVQSGAKVDGIVAYVKGRPAPPQESGGCEAGQRLLEVEALGEVQEAQRDQQTYCDVERAAPPAIEVEGRHDEAGGGRQGQRVEDANLIERLDVEQSPVPPARVRGRRGNDVDDSGSQGGEGGERGQGVRAAEAAQWRCPPVQPELPGGGVPARGGDVPPVLDDQPETGERREDGRDVELDHAGQRSHRQRGEDREAEVILVDPTAKDVNARPERMSLEAEHLAHTVPRTFGRGHFQRLCGRAERLPELLA